MKDVWKKPDLVAHSCHASASKTEAGGLFCGFEESLDYVVNSRIVKTTEQDLVLTLPKKREKEKREGGRDKWKEGVVEGRSPRSFYSCLADCCVCSAWSGGVCLETSYFFSSTSIHNVGRRDKNHVHNEQNSSGTAPRAQELPGVPSPLWLAFHRQASLSTDSSSNQWLIRLVRMRSELNVGS